MTDSRLIHIDVPALTRVEGEGALDIKIRDGKIENLQLKIFEPPRYFEKFLEGRKAQDVIDIVARICGICPVAYQMSAVQAIEQAAGIQVSDWVNDMRRVMYCGEWIQSHSLHIHLLALPDYYGVKSVAELATKMPEEVKRGLHLQALGNKLIALFGARSVHPVGVRPGGFFHAPQHETVSALVAELEPAIKQAEALIQWVAKVTIPEDEQTFESVSLRSASEYPMNAGRLVSSGGLDIDIADYDAHFSESTVYHSTALHCHLNNKPYLVGPLARINNNLDKIPEATKKLINGLLVQFPSKNMFHSMLARAIEIHIALTEAIKILQNYERPDKPFVESITKAGVAFGCTEAPRGTLWHRYEFNNVGEVVGARIVPPTSQNQARIEQDLASALQQFGLDNPDDDLRLLGEKVVRNYDPCISCATHFLKLNVER